MPFGLLSSSAVTQTELRTELGTVTLAWPKPLLKSIDGISEPD